MLNNPDLKIRSVSLILLVIFAAAFGSLPAGSRAVGSATDDPISAGTYESSSCPSTHPISVFDNGNRLCYTASAYSRLAPAASVNITWLPEPQELTWRPGQLGNNSLSRCIEQVPIDCIKRLEVKRSGENWRQASYVGPALNPGVPQRWGAPSFSADIQQNLGDPTCCNLYEQASVSLGAERFFVQVLFDGRKTGPRTYRLLIAPVERLGMTDSGCLRQTGDHVFMDNTFEPQVLAPYCYGVVARDYEFRLTLELRQPISGWIETRISDASWSQTSMVDGSQAIEFSLEGKTVIAPSARLSVPITNPGERAMYCNSDLPVGRNFCNTENKVSWSAILAQPSGNGMDAFAVYRRALEIFPRVDYAVREFRTWTAIVKQSDSRNLNQCTSQQGAIYGIVGSNAMLMSSDLPRWNQETNSIDFAVLSPHYLSDGRVAQGMYEMQLNEQVAQCLWGTKITPQNVSLSVIDDKGESKAAVATVAVRSGMVIFRASGFTYSVSTLRAALKKVEPADAPRVSKPFGRLRCIKNSVTKLQPRGATVCPRGWRKK